MSKDDHNARGCCTTGGKSCFDQSRADALPLKVRQYGHWSEPSRLNRRGFCHEGHWAQRDGPDQTTVLDCDQGEGACLRTSQRLHQLGCAWSATRCGVDRVHRHVIFRCFSTYGAHGSALEHAYNPHNA